MNTVRHEDVMTDEVVEHVPSVSEIRRERERREMTERIMDVAREMLVRDGYEAVTLRGIAQAIEYSQASIYQYFEDKQALVEAIIRRDSEDLRSCLLECLRVGEPVYRLVEMARLYATWGITHPNHYRLLMVPPPGWVENDKKGDGNNTPLEREMLLVMHGAVSDAMEKGLVKSKYSNPALVASTLWAGIHGLVLLEITMGHGDRALLGGPDITFDSRFETLAEAFMDGFLAERL